ncbi:MAG: type II toxin-antitoxin system YafQ family toxin [Bacteroidetes bacterium]|nr:type II toxin-antitoxin system YafQ family toxin [Bacteroidota bacterium]
MYKVITSKKYRRDLKRIKRMPLDMKKLNLVIDLLSGSDKPLPEKYNDHKLLGEFAGYRECHIEPDWLLVYKKERRNLVLVLTRTGSHSDLFN